MLDPFLPERSDDVDRLKAIQKEVHEMFIALVKGRRGDKLTGPDSSLFSGEFWTGNTARGLGLIDRIGDLRSVLRERFGEKVATPLVAAERGLFGRRISALGSTIEDDFEPGGLAGGFAEGLISAVEARALWARYGL
jgi:serine protease SohB